MALVERSARWPWKGDTPTHIPRPPIVPQAFLLPGDPARVDMAAAVLDDFTIVGQNREFRMGVGTYRDLPIGICSTGIGGPSTEITAVELCALGARVLIRTGGTGAISPTLQLGDFLVVRETIASSASARPYAPGDGNVLADAALVATLEASRVELGLPGRTGIAATVDGYYRSQGRPDRADGASDPSVIDRLAARGADCIEMETETVLAVGGAMGISAAAVLAIHAHRESDAWLEDYEETQLNVLRLAAEAARRTLW